MGTGTRPGAVLDELLLVGTSTCPRATGLGRRVCSAGWLDPARRRPSRAAAFLLLFYHVRCRFLGQRGVTLSAHTVIHLQLHCYFSLPASLKPPFCMSSV